MSIEYVDKIINKDLDSNIKIACYNLTSILSDTNGKMNKSTQGLLLSLVEMTAPGVCLVDLSDQTVNVDKWSDKLILEQFIPEVSSYTFDLYNSIKNNDAQFVIPATESSSNLNVSSPLLLNSRALSNSTKTVLNVVYIELFSLYLNLLSLQPDTSLKDINRSDLIRLDNNIRWLSNQIEAPDIQNYDLIRMIRDAQKTVLFVRSMTHLFVETYKVSLVTFDGG